MSKSVIRFHMRLAAEVRREGDWVYSACPVLDVYSQGRSEMEALANLAEALHLFVESCYNRGTLDEVLKESGFEPDGTDEPEDDDGRYVDVDLPLSRAARHDAEARAH